MPHADDADGGVLGVYLAKPMPPREMIRLCAQVLIGRWKAHPRISEKQVTDVVLLFPKLKASAKAVIDGELIDLERRVELRIHPKALKVVAPASSAGTATAADRAETGPGIDRIGAG